MMEFKRKSNIKKDLRLHVKEDIEWKTRQFGISKKDNTIRRRYEL